MKEPNNTSWEALEKAWQKQVQETSDKVPSNLWDELEAHLDEKPIRPLWSRLSLSPWTWSAAAILAVVIGINWENSTPATQQSVAQTKVLAPVKEEAGIVAVQESHKGVSLIETKPVEVHYSQGESIPALEQSIVAQEPIEIIAKAEEKPAQAEEIWVRIDINPIEENAKPVEVAQKEAPVVTKKKTLMGRLLKQVIQVVAGEQLDWQELKEGNRPLEDGIHQVVNTYYRTEQSIKQTLQIQ
jgi:hypothetical protein